MRYGYARCSLNDTKQDIERQVRELMAKGCERENIFLEHEHGDSEVKAEFEKLLKRTRRGDMIIATELTRFARTTRLMCLFLEDIERHWLRLEAGKFTADCTDGQLDPMDNAFIQMGGVTSEWELRSLKTRIRSGLANAKAKGVTLGRPKLSADSLPKTFYRYYPVYKSGKLTKFHFARACGVARTTLDRYLSLVETDKLT